MNKFVKWLNNLGRPDNAYTRAIDNATPEDKFCVLCKHYRYEGPGVEKCHKTAIVELVHGVKVLEDCWSTRNNPDKCSCLGSWFERKTPQ